MGTIAESRTPDSGVQDGVVCGFSPNGQKLIIDTDPGVGQLLSPLSALLPHLFNSSFIINNLPMFGPTHKWTQLTANVFFFFPYQV